MERILLKSTLGAIFFVIYSFSPLSNNYAKDTTNIDSFANIHSPLKIIPEENQGGDYIIDSFKKSIENINDYQCIFEEYAISKGQEENRIYKYFFKRPYSIRIEVLHGREKGNIAVFREGKVRGKRRGLFSFITLNLSLTDKRVTNIRGDTIDKSDWFYVLNNVLYQQKHDGISSIKKDFYKNKDGYLILLKGSERLINKEKLWIDTRNFLPFHIERYDRGGHLVHAITYKNIKINQNLEEDFFKL